MSVRVKNNTNDDVEFSLKQDGDDVNLYANDVLVAWITPDTIFHFAVLDENDVVPTFDEGGDLYWRYEF